MYTLPDYEARDTPWFNPVEASNILPGSMELILTEEEDTERKETRNRVLKSSSRNMPTEWPTSLFASNDPNPRPSPEEKPRWAPTPTRRSEIGPDGLTARIGEKSIDDALWGLRRHQSTGGSKRRNSKRKKSRKKKSRRRNSKRRNSKRRNSKRRNSKRRDSKRRNSLNM
jgi:hypothetical protein